MSRLLLEPLLPVEENVEGSNVSSCQFYEASRRSATAGNCRAHELFYGEQNTVHGASCDPPTCKAHQEHEKRFRVVK